MVQNCVILKTFCFNVSIFIVLDTLQPKKRDQYLQTNLDLEHVHMKALLDGNLSTTSGIERCIEAAEALQKCMHSEIHPCKYTS